MEKESSDDAKKMLIEIFSSTKQKTKNQVFIQDECDELEEETSNDYFEPPVVPKSCNNGGIKYIKFTAIEKKIQYDMHNAFKESADGTLTSNIPESQSVGSTVSLKTFVLDPPMEYEEIIQKLEADIRKHIRIQNQLKLHIESLQGKIDEKEKAEVAKDSEIEQLTESNKKLKQSMIDFDRK
jgi:hypothetical protein